MVTAYAATYAGSELSPFEYTHEKLNDQEVEITVMHCGVCHSDISMINNDWGITQYPIVPGHEIIGKISQVGKAVTNLNIGQVVGVGWHSGYCNQCSCCISGNQNLCTASQPTIIGHYGGFSDKIYASAESVFPIPSGLKYENAGPLLCAGITIYTPLIQYKISPTDKVAVVGIGGLGHLALQFLNKWGCEVTAFTSSQKKRNEALKLGAHYVSDSRDTKSLAAAEGQFDFIIVTVNVKLDWNSYLNALKPQGKLHFVGIVLDPLEINSLSLIMGQKSMSGTIVGNPTDITTMLEFASRHKIEPMTEHFPMTNVNRAIEAVRTNTVKHRAVLSV